jgi:hypothetical protein
MSDRRKFLGQAATAGLVAISPVQVARPAKETPKRSSIGGPEPIFEKPAAKTVADLAATSTRAVSAIEVNDYAPGHYKGALTPSPPHADLNAKKGCSRRLEGQSVQVCIQP